MIQTISDNLTFNALKFIKHGQLKITNAVEEEYRTGIFPKPNRFIWIDPKTYHDVTTVGSDVTHCRVANVGFLGGDIGIDPVGTDFINISTTN